MRKYIDLHMHTNFSDDGEFSPEELVEMCVAAGVEIMAIADHNSVRGVERGRRAAKKAGIRYIPAIEIDCTYEETNLHVLGYGIDYKHNDFTEIEENIISQELKCSQKKIELTKNIGFEVTKEEMDEVSPKGIYLGEMFAEVILKKAEHADSELLKPYREGGSRSDNPYVNFYWDFYAQGKPCYTRILYPSCEDIIKLIHNRGGAAVLAHPGNNLDGHFSMFEKIISLGLDGVEAFSNYHSKDTVEYFYKKGMEYNLLITCGSDFHGKTKPSIKLGECRCPYDEGFIEDELKARKLI